MNIVNKKLIDSYFEGDISEEDAELVLEWFGTEEGGRWLSARFEEDAAAVINKLNPSSELYRIPEPRNEWGEEGDSEPVRKLTIERGGINRNSTPRWIVIAAVFLTAILISLFQFYYSNPVPQPSEFFTEYTTTAEEHRIITLNDGPGFTAQRITQALLHMNRDMSMQYPDGRKGTGDLIGGTWNAYVMANTGETQRVHHDVVSTAGFNYQLSSSLSFDGDFTLNQRASEELIFREDRSNMIHPLTGATVAASSWFATNTLNEGRYNRRELSQRAYFNFEESFDIHRVSAVAGYEEVYTTAKQVSAARANFFNDELRSLGSGDSGNQLTCGQFNDAGSFTSGCFNDAWRVRSFFSRLNYIFDDRYSLQANLRYDGSSRFAEGN